MRWGRIAVRGLLGLVAVIVVLAGVLAVRAYLLERPTAASASSPELGVDVEAASQRLAEAVRLRTEADAEGLPKDPQSFLDLQRLLQESYPLAQGALERELVNDFSLIYRWPGSDSALAPILLTAHQDVVPENGTWSKPAFSGLVEDGYLWGRGTLDDKVSVLGILEAVEALLAQDFRPERTVYLAFGQDEEINGTQGAQTMAGLFRERGIRFWFALDEGSPIGEGLVPGVEGPVALIGTAEKGYLSVELVAETPGGHSSMPSRNSAILVLLQALDRLAADADKAELGPPFSDSLDAVAPHLGFLGRVVLANLWLFGPVVIDQMMAMPEARAMISTTEAVTVIGAGEADNVLPSRASAIVNYRLLPGTTVAATLERIRAVIDDAQITVSQVGEANDPSPISDPESESYRLLRRTVEEVFPDALAIPTLVIAATDARHYVGVADQVYRFLPTRLGAEDLSRLHGVDERIAIENYAEIIDFYGQLLRNAAGPG